MMDILSTTVPGPPSTTPVSPRLFGGLDSGNVNVSSGSSSFAVAARRAMVAAAAVAAVSGSGDDSNQFAAVAAAIHSGRNGSSDENLRLTATTTTSTTPPTSQSRNSNEFSSPSNKLSLLFVPNVNNDILSDNKSDKCSELVGGYRIDGQNGSKVMDEEEEDDLNASEMEQEDSSVFIDEDDMSIRRVDSDDGIVIDSERTSHSDINQFSNSLALNYAMIPSEHRKNKRKNFRPRNITYETSSGTEDMDTSSCSRVDVDSLYPLNLSSNSSKKTLLPRKLERENSPMDLSTASVTDDDLVLNSVKPPGGLSVVPPEVLFGDKSLPMLSSTAPPAEVLASVRTPSHTTSPTGPFQLENGVFLNHPTYQVQPPSATAMKDAFQEVLKLYGVPNELAEMISKNAQQVSNPDILNLTAASAGNLQLPLFQRSSATTVHPPAMLSAALMGGGNASVGNPCHPPTPPRTPMEYSAQSPLDVASINSVHSNNILASQLTKPLILPPGVIGTSAHSATNSSSPSSPSPHILAAQIAAANALGSGGCKQASSCDYTRYFKRFGSSLECGSCFCKDMNYREHFHCTVMMCKNKVFAKKEEMIRHSKWHQKMDEAFKYGFRRVTPMDDCESQFPGCGHNKKQTHYHCIQNEGFCDKVYISTSDVQMHFNYHRKDNAIQREGFMRFRGSEDCQASYCAYRGQKTTHFHCNRSSCQFTFKNKADLEKHKNYHMKDEQLNRDGFKKFMKHEVCGFGECRFSKSVNHIHCIRSGCDYVLHSSGQLYSHKRKHERRDNEAAYRKYKIAHGATSEDLNQAIRPDSCESSADSIGSTSSPPSLVVPPFSVSSIMNHHEKSTVIKSLKSEYDQDLNSSDQSESPRPIQQNMDEGIPDDIWQNYLLHCEAGEGCGFQGCDCEEAEHFHCKDDGCESVFRSLDDVIEHGRNHYLQDRISDIIFLKIDGEDEEDVENGDDDRFSQRMDRSFFQAICSDTCPYKRNMTHYHCKLENCNEVILAKTSFCDTPEAGGNGSNGNDTSVSSSPFTRLDHYKLHEYMRRWKLANHMASDNHNENDSIIDAKHVSFLNNKIPLTKGPNQSEFVSMTLTTNVDAMFKRKRGRPPKNRIVEVWDENFTSSTVGGISMGSTSPQAVFTSFKLPKTGNVTNSTFSQTSNANLSSDLIKYTQSYVSSSNGPTTVMSAPLGGLPIIEVQKEAAAAVAMVSKWDGGLSDNEIQPSVMEESQIIKSPLPIEVNNENTESTDVSPKTAALIKAKGTYYPLTAFPTSMPQGPVMHQHDSGAVSCSVGTVVEENNSSPTVSMKSKHGVNFTVSLSRDNDELNPLSSGNKSSCSSSSSLTYFEMPVETPLSMLLRNSNHNELINEHRLSIIAHPLFGPEPEENSCGRPFCKLKRKSHYHCNICNQGFTEKEKLEIHLKKHEAEGIPPVFPALPMVPGLPAIPPHLASILASDTSLKVPSVKGYDMRFPLPINAVNDHERPTETPTPPAKTESPMQQSSSAASASSISPGLIMPLSLSSSPCLNTENVNVPSSCYSPSAAFNFANIRHPIFPPTSTAGIPFMSPGFIMPPNMSGLFQQLPITETVRHQLPVNIFDPIKHPLTQMQQQEFHHIQGGPKRPLSTSSAGVGPLSVSTNAAFNEDEIMMENKKQKLQISMRMLKDEPVPEGYMRFRFNEDCCFQFCNYREHQTHFHCMRKDCNYRFCDKTRFVQHTARHERLDTLCGSEFHGFRGVSCQREMCDLNIDNNRGDGQKSSSHFHCLKCEYYCTDTNKVVAHRRQHQKLDSIMAAGFDKFTPTQQCSISGCVHNGKQTHYHCRLCQYSVLGLSQMEAHKYRHLND